MNGHNWYHMMVFPQILHSSSHLHGSATNLGGKGVSPKQELQTQPSVLEPRWVQCPPTLLWAAMKNTPQQPALRGLSFSLPLAHMHTCVHTGFYLSLPTLPWFMSSSSYNQTIVIVSQLLALPVPSMLALVYPQIASAVSNTHFFVVQLVSSSLGTKSTISFIKQRTTYTCFVSAFNRGPL